MATSSSKTTDREILEALVDDVSDAVRKASWSLLGGDPATEQPPKGSVVMAQGRTGTAWQRFMSDGKWHSTSNGRIATWDELVAEEFKYGRPAPFIIYDTTGMVPSK